MDLIASERHRQFSNRPSGVPPRKAHRANRNETVAPASPLAESDAPRKDFGFAECELRGGWARLTCLPYHVRPHSHRGVPKHRGGRGGQRMVHHNSASLVFFQGKRLRSGFGAVPAGPYPAVSA